MPSRDDVQEEGVAFGQWKPSAAKGRVLGVLKSAAPLCAVLVLVLVGYLVGMDSGSLFRMEINFRGDSSSSSNASMDTRDLYAVCPQAPA